MKATHQKKPYLAKALQWDGENTQEIMHMFPLGARADVYLRPPYTIQHLCVRYETDITTITPGWWVVIGENGAVKMYSDEVFRVKYQPLEEVIK